MLADHNSELRDFYRGDVTLSGKHILTVLHERVFDFFRSLPSGWPFTPLSSWKVIDVSFFFEENDQLGGGTLFEAAKGYP